MRISDWISDVCSSDLWSHLASSSSHDRSAPKLLAHFVAGDLVLLGARPGHGKTLLGLELAVEAARTGHRSFFFSLEETESSISKRLQGLGSDMDHTGNALVIDPSDDICRSEEHTSKLQAHLRNTIADFP